MTGAQQVLLALALVIQSLQGIALAGHRDARSQFMTRIWLASVAARVAIVAALAVSLFTGDSG
jgi:hypothetical protein